MPTPESQNWTTRGKAGFFPFLAEAIKSGQDFHVHTLAERESTKPPVLEIPVEVQFYGRNSGNNGALWEFAALACGVMDWEAKAFGLWGAECRFEEVLRRPKLGTLELAKNGDANGFYSQGSYLYTPRRQGKDSFWFVLGNGASRRVEVRFLLNVSRFEPEP